MTPAGKSRQFPFLAITTLSIAAAGITAPAWAPDALASAEHATTATAQTATAPSVQPRPAASPASPAIAGHGWSGRKR